MAVESLLQPASVLRTSAIAVLVVLLIKFAIGVYRYVKKFKFFNNLPGETDFHWLYGNLHKLPKDGEHRLNYGRSFMDKLNTKISRTWFGSMRPVVTVYHPETVKQVYKSSAPKSRGFGTGYELGQPWIGEGLIASNGHTWARSRRLLTPAFHFDILKPYINIYNQAADNLFEKLDKYAESGEKFDFCPLLTLCTLEVLLKCAMSYDVDIQKTGHHPYAQATRELVAAWALRGRSPFMWPEWIYRRTKEGKQFFKNCDYVHQVAEELIEKRKKAMEKDGPPKNRHLDFLDILLMARDEDGKPMTNLEIRNEVDTFMFAGHDTTATGAPWILYNFAIYPEYQRKVQAELDETLAGRDTDAIQWNDVPKLENLNLCLKESFRLYPPVPFIGRHLSEPVKVDGKVIPAGSQVTIGIAHLHRNPDVWDKPDDFIPERFLKENMKNRDSFAYTPFSAGARNCIGQNFALYEEKVVVGRILKRYDLEFAEDGPPPKRLASVVLKAENGLWFRIKKRAV